MSSDGRSVKLPEELAVELTRVAQANALDLYSAVVYPEFARFGDPIFRTRCPSAIAGHAAWLRRGRENPPIGGQDCLRRTAVSRYVGWPVFATLTMRLMTVPV
jgi:hypothetical protein